MTVMQPLPSQHESSALRPVKNAAARQNHIFSPPQHAYVNPSPLKPLRPHQMPQNAPTPFSQFNNMVPMPAPLASSYHTDSMQKRSSMPNAFPMLPPKTTFTTFVPSNPMGKENHAPQMYGVTSAPHPSSSYGNDFLCNDNFNIITTHLAAKPTLKRSLMDAAPIIEPRPTKRHKVTLENVEQARERRGSDAHDLPPPHAFPDLIDDGTKPSHSYAQLIGMAILRAPRRRLTLAQIYKWISDTYSFYSKEEATGWQNSIRHNLSLNKAFIKQERPKDDPGKGNYWAIQPGMEQQFIKDKIFKKAGDTSDASPLASQEFESKPAEETPHGSCSLMSPTAAQTHVDKTSATSGRIDAPSSDATIPESEIDAEGQYEAERACVPSSPFMRSSPPTALMQSSPPVAQADQHKHDTPPAVPRFPASSASQSHKRKFASMDDSGYISSLDSSALRQSRPVSRKASDGDRARAKRGRAEEEIARLRGSSYDSPTRARTFANMVPLNSSPIRISQSPAKMLPPLTPMVKLKAPNKPPPSVSPNTNLRMHRALVRKLVGSPLRDVSNIDDPLPYSPEFNLEANKRLFEEYKTMDTHSDVDYQCLADQFWFPINGMDSGCNESPLRNAIIRRRSPERPRSVPALGDITNSAMSRPLSTLTSTPTFKFTPVLASSTYVSPTKNSSYMDSPLKGFGLAPLPKMLSPAVNFTQFSLPGDELYQTLVAEEAEDTIGVDLMNPFPKIGANGHAKQGGRPMLGRSATSRF